MLPPRTGELVRALQMPESAFLSQRAKLRGMNETNCRAALAPAAAGVAAVRKRVYEAANVLAVPCSSEDGDELRFVGKTLSAGVTVLVTIKLDASGDGADIGINCEKIVVGSMLAKEIKAALEAQ